VAAAEVLGDAVYLLKRVAYGSEKLFAFIYKREKRGQPGLRFFCLNGE
jgi:hypothetical protein